MMVQEGNTKLYIGIAPVSVLAVNPRKDYLNILFNTSLEKEPEYLSKREINGELVPCVRIDFFVKTVPDLAEGVDLVSKVSFFLIQQFCTTKDGRKVKVIDKYGRTVWVTLDEFASHSIPIYKNGPAQIDRDYRGCYPGEEEITSFLKILLNIPNVPEKNSDSPWMPEDEDDYAHCEARLSNIDKFFTGEFELLNEIISFYPQSRIKVMFGVRTTDEGEKRQTVYNHKFLRASEKNYTKVAEDLSNCKLRGLYYNTEYSTDTIHEFVDSSY